MKYTFEVISKNKNKKTKQYYSVYSIWYEKPELGPLLRGNMYNNTDEAYFLSLKVIRHIKKIGKNFYNTDSFIFNIINKD